MSGLLQDSNGNKSSKRVVGSIVAGAGLLLLLSIGVASIFTIVKDPGTAMESGKTILIVGAGLLGVSVVEFFGAKK